jgi:hypothetical protein
MAISMESTVSEILDNPTLAALAEDLVPGITRHPMIKMARGLTLSKIIQNPAAKNYEEKLLSFISAANAKGF